MMKGVYRKVLPAKDDTAGTPFLDKKHQPKSKNQKT